MSDIPGPPSSGESGERSSSDETPPAAGQARRRRGGFGSDVFKLVGGTTLAQIITVLTAPILSRLYDPNDFGTLSVFVSLIGIVAVVVCLRYEYAIVLPEQDDEALNVAATSLAAALLVSGMGVVVIAVAGEAIVRVLNAPDLAPFLWLMPLALAIQGVFQTANQWNGRLRRFGRVSTARVAASLTTSALPMGLAALGRAGPGALIGSWFAGTAVSTGLLAGQALRRGPGSVQRRLLLSRISWSGIAYSLKRYRKFPLVDSWGALLNNLSWQLPNLMLSAFFSTAIVGLYSLSSRIILLPMTLVGNAVGQVFYQKAAELRHDRQALARTAEMVFGRLVALGLLPALALTILGEELFTVVFGPNWAEAGVYAQILAPWMFLLVVSSPLSNLFAILERQELALIVQVFIFGTRLAALILGGRQQNVYLALQLWTVTGILVYGGLAIWNMTLAGVSWRTIGRILLRFTGYGLPAALALALIGVWLPTSWILLVAVAGVAVAYYALTLWNDPGLYSFLRRLAARRAKPT